MTRTAGIYTRISLDPRGTRLGVTRQLEACTAKAAELGWPVHEAYEDNDVSAYTGVHRPAYERLLRDIRHGVIDAVIVWDLDRLTRRPIEIEHFIDLADTHHVALASIGGDFDLSTDNGRMFARIKGAVARSEIERRSARMRAASDQAAAAGLPRTGGRRAYGYTSAYEMIPAEAAFLREAADRILSGSSLRGTATWLNQAGSTTTTGRPWNTNSLGDAIVKPTLAALRVHRGQVVGPGTWEPIFDTETHAALVAKVRDPARPRRGRPVTYLLSGIARCGTCGLHVGGTTGYHGRATSRTYPVYYCHSRAHIARAIGPVDEYVTQVITRRLARPDALTLLAPTRDHARVEELHAQEAQLRTRLDGLAEAYAAGAIDDLQLRAGTKRVRAELDHASRQVAAAVSNPILTRLVASGDVRATWDNHLGIEERRELLRAFTTVTVHSPGQGARYFDPDTVTVTMQRNDDATAPSARGPAGS